MSSRIVIAGAGAWGTALGKTLGDAGHDIRFWRRGEALSAQSTADIMVLAVPAQATRGVLAELFPDLTKRVPLILTAKGLERDSLLRQSQIAAEIAPDHPVAVLSGPSFAADLVKGLPTAVTLATAAPEGPELQRALSTAHLRPYLGGDVPGAEFGGALKNVIAIACGAAMGAGLGESARAALMARGFAEMRRLALAAGAEAETLAGLSGLGDLTLTCTSRLSRNYQYGHALGATGAPPVEGTFEGAATADAAMALAEGHGVDAPIIAVVSALVAGRTGVQEAINTLFLRPLGYE